MYAYACGFLGQQPDISTSFRVLSDNETRSSLVPGGWGCVGLVCQGALRLHAEQARVSQQQDARQAAIHQHLNAMSAVRSTIST